MPCRDYYDDNPSAYYADTIAGLKKQVSFAESALCLALNTFEQVLTNFKAEFDINIKTNPLDVMVIEEAGIKRDELETWWTRHKILDAKHRAEEEARAREHRIRNQALAKLSAEEKKVLGIK